MERLDAHIEEQLHAYHMGWLQRHEMGQVERLIESSPQIARRSRELMNQIEPLADWQALPAVADLETHVLRRLDVGMRAVDSSAEVAFRLDPVSENRVVRFRISLGEFLAVAACIAILCAVVVPSLVKGSSLAQRVRCADNLHQIAQALSAYSGDFDAQLPYAGPGGNWLRERSPGVPRMHNSRHRFLLVSQGYLPDASSYVCPADPDGVIMRFDDVRNFSDFAEHRNCSYDSQILVAGGRSVADYPGMVVWSDANPIFDNPAEIPPNPDTFNSRNHPGRRGQNILRLDGAVNWAMSPTVGVQDDNIWQIGGRLSYSGREIPTLATDSFMVP